MAVVTMSQIIKTVALTTTAQSIYNLLVSAGFVNCPRQAALIEVWGDAVLTTGLIYCGDALVSSTNHGFVIASEGDCWRFKGEWNEHSLTDKYLRASAGTPSVNITIVCR